MSEERPPPPPRKPPPPLTLITDGDVSDTERLPAPEAPPRMPEPFRRLRDTSKQPATIREFAERVYSCEAAARENLALQRKLALEMDGVITAVNTRFNIFHQELALLRSEVVRVETGVDDKIDVAIEEAIPLSQRAKRFAAVGSTKALEATIGGVVLLFATRLAAAKWPWLADILRSVQP